MVDFITIHVLLFTLVLHVHSSFTVTATLLIQCFNDFSHQSLIMLCTLMTIPGAHEENTHALFMYIQ